MHYPNLPRVTRSRLFVAMMDCLAGLTSENDAASAACLAEAVSFADASKYSLSELFTAAEAIASMRDEIAFGQAVIYDLDSLTAALGTDIAVMALRLNGATYDPVRKRWTDGPHPKITVNFPSDFFTTFLKGWAERA